MAVQGDFADGLRRLGLGGVLAAARHGAAVSGGVGSPGVAPVNAMGKIIRTDLAAILGSATPL
jgi:hypothetical protein